MNHPHGDDPIEHDPTGMRALLGSLPDPAPMSPDLVTRIEAALAEEARTRAEAWAAPECPPELRADEGTHRGTVGSVGLAGAPAGDPPGANAGVVVPLRRRTGWRVLAAAAAVVGVLGLGGLVLETTTPGGVQAALGVADDSAGSSAESAASGADDSTDGGAGTDRQALQGGAGAVVASDRALRVEVLAGGGAVSSADLADVAGQVPPASYETSGTGSSSGPGEQPDALDDAGTPRPVASAAGARACASALGVPTGDEVVVRLSVVDDVDAAVVVAAGADGSRTAWAVAVTCTASDPGVIAGPVAVG